jgi:protein phosphatase
MAAGVTRGAMTDFELRIPAKSLVVLVGASGSGKSTFAQAHFRPTEVLSSDGCRALVSDDESDQAASQDAFDVLRFIAARRLRLARLTVADATNVRLEQRAPLLALARKHEIPCVAIVFDVPEELCLDRNRSRAGRIVDASVVRKQIRDLRESLRSLHEEGFSRVYVFSSPDDIALTTIVRIPPR